MKMLSIMALTALSFAMPQMTARDYYKELRDAGGLNRYKDEYACFADGDDNQMFMLVAKVSDTIAAMKDAHEDHGAEVLESYKKSILIAYVTKGVEGRQWVFEPEDSDYSMVFETPYPGKMKYSANWTTGRYRLQVYDKRKSTVNPVMEDTGKCELIHPNQVTASAQ
jgi:hypothetical protein